MKTRVNLKYFVNDCRPTLVKTGFNETLFINLSLVLINVVEIVNTNYDSYAQLSVPNKIKNINVKALNLLLGIKEKRSLI